MTVNEHRWESTGGFHRHNHVYYHIWRRMDDDGKYMYQCTLETCTPPSMTSGGYASVKSLIFTKFGTHI